MTSRVTYAAASSAACPRDQSIPSTGALTLGSKPARAPERTNPGPVRKRRRQRRRWGALLPNFLSSSPLFPLSPLPPLSAASDFPSLPYIPLLPPSFPRPRTQLFSLSRWLGICCFYLFLVLERRRKTLRDVRRAPTPFAGRRRPRSTRLTTRISQLKQQQQLDKTEGTRFRSLFVSVPLFKEWVPV